jgi:hypothetical protein
VPGKVGSGLDAAALANFVPGFRRIDFVEVIQDSGWPE